MWQCILQQNPPKQLTRLAGEAQESAMHATCPTKITQVITKQVAQDTQDTRDNHGVSVKLGLTWSSRLEVGILDVCAEPTKWQVCNTRARLTNEHGASGVVCQAVGVGAALLYNRGRASLRNREAAEEPYQPISVCS
jgi:hypothetical protein